MARIWVGGMLWRGPVMMILWVQKKYHRVFICELVKRKVLFFIVEVQVPCWGG